MGVKIKPFLLIFFLASASLYGQTIAQIKVSGQFDNQPLAEIVQELLKDQSLALFIASRNLENQNKTITFEDVPLPQALDQLFLGTPVNFVIYRDYAVIVGPRSKINQSYGAEYYSRFEEIISAVPESDEITIGDKNLLQPFELVEVRGIIVDDLTGEEVVGASVILKDSSNMTTFRCIWSIQT